MRYFAAVLILSLLIGTAACTGNKAEELYNTAKFEELQNNRDHARELYEEIVSRYPGSDYAKMAQERLAALKTEPKK